MLKHLPWRETVWAIGFVALLALLYAGSYYAMVIPCMIPTITSLDELVSAEPIGYCDHVDYAFGGETAKSLFAPMNQLDRSLRPGVWNPSMVTLP